MRIHALEVATGVALLRGLVCLLIARLVFVGLALLVVEIFGLQLGAPQLDPGASEIAFLGEPFGLGRPGRGYFLFCQWCRRGFVGPAIVGDDAVGLVVLAFVALAAFRAALRILQLASYRQLLRIGGLS